MIVSFGCGESALLASYRDNDHHREQIGLVTRP
jgi:hypothetical protein